MDFPRNMMLSIDIIPMGMDDAIKMVDKVIMSVESDATRIQQRQMSKNLYLAKLPYQVEQMQKVSKEYMDDLTERDQRIMFGLVTLTHLADSVEQLDQDTESLKSRTGNCEFATLKYQQEDGLNTVLPYGLRRIDATRTLTTESTAVLMPFQSQEIQHTGGIYYGVNAVSHNLIICNRESLMNGNGFILGVSGSGKSMAAKIEIVIRALASKHTIIVVDPEREYGPLIKALGGEVITISASSTSYINALDISAEYGDGSNPLGLKSDFIMSLCEQIMGTDGIDARAKRSANPEQKAPYSMPRIRWNRTANAALFSPLTVRAAPCGKPSSAGNAGKSQRTPSREKNALPKRSRAPRKSARKSEAARSTLTSTHG